MSCGTHAQRSEARCQKRSFGGHPARLTLTRLSTLLAVRVLWANSMSGALGTTEPFAAALLGLVGAQLPLSIEQQAMLVSLLGIYVVFSGLLLLLLTLYGIGSCCEGIFACCSVFSCCCRRTDGIDEFVVLDEKTDIDAVAFNTLARAELVDGTPPLP